MILPDPYFINVFNEKELYEESFFDLNLIDEEFPFDKIIEKDNECCNNNENKLYNSTIKYIENDSNTENNIFNFCKKKEFELNKSMNNSSEKKLKKIFLIKKTKKKPKEERNIKRKKKKKIYKCLCGKQFLTRENQILHFKNTHLNHKTYECSYCHRKFTHRNGKTYHERIFHTFIFPYKCYIDECKKEFASKSALNYHVKYKH